MRGELYRLRAIRRDLFLHGFFLFRPALQRLRYPRGLEIHLRQRNAAVEYLAVTRDQAVLQPDLGYSGKIHAHALAARDLGGVGEIMARVGQAAVAQGIGKRPGEIARIGVEMIFDHAANRLAPAELAVETVVINPVWYKAGRSGGAVAAANPFRHSHH